MFGEVVVALKGKAAVVTDVFADGRVDRALVLEEVTSARKGLAASIAAATKFRGGAVGSLVGGTAAFCDVRDGHGTRPGHGFGKGRLGYEERGGGSDKGR